ncbi:MAG: hypothetical protein WB997_08460 [Candidatus Acidiferrales bacterium]
MTAEPDVYAPTIPFYISAFANGCAVDGVSLSWDASSTDIGSGVASYYVYRNGGFVGAFSPSVSSYTDYDVFSNEHITYKVDAVDNAGNASGQIGTTVHIPICEDEMVLAGLRRKNPSPFVSTRLGDLLAVHFALHLGFAASPWNLKLLHISLASDSPNVRRQIGLLTSKRIESARPLIETKNSPPRESKPAPPPNGRSSTGGGQ